MLPTGAARANLPGRYACESYRSNPLDSSFVRSRARNRFPWGQTGSKRSPHLVFAPGAGKSELGYCNP